MKNQERIYWVSHLVIKPNGAEYGWVDNFLPCPGDVNHILHTYII